MFQKNKFQIVILSQTFYEKNKNNTEILFNKNGRPYLKILIKFGEFTFAIPLRSNIDPNKINNRKSYKLYSHRSGGLDYNKAVIVKKEDIEKSSNNIIDNKCYGFINHNIDKIYTEFKKFLKDYQKAIIKQDKNILKKYNFTSLEYYQEEIKTINFNI